MYIYSQLFPGVHLQLVVHLFADKLMYIILSYFTRYDVDAQIEEDQSR